MEVSPFSRSVSSAAYNFLRWAGAAIAPILAGYLGQTYGFSLPFYITAFVVVLTAIGLDHYSSLLRNAISYSPEELALSKP